MIHKKIADLDFSIQKKAEECWQEMQNDSKLKEMGVESVAINETARELSVQIAYYCCGRMKPEFVKNIYAATGLYAIGDEEAKQIKTNTLRSNHILGKAIDFCPVHDGKLWWTAPKEVWERMGEIGEKNGFKWGGRWKGFPDSPHFEV